MQWEAAPLFATPLFKLRIGDTDAVRHYFHDRIKGETDARDDRGVLSHYHSRGGLFERHPDLSPLRDTLEMAGSFVYRELMNYADSGPMRLTQAWFNLCEPGGSQPVHAHTNALLCGTLYLHADEATHLDFHHPADLPTAQPELHDVASDAPNAHGLSFHKRRSRIRVATGDCLFWPAPLRHGYSDNRTPGRLTLSFNMVPSAFNLDYQPFPAPDTRA